MPAFENTIAAAATSVTAATTTSINVPICGAASCTGSSFYLAITGLALTNDVSVVNAESTVTLPAVFPVNDLSYCKLTATTASGYAVTGTVHPFNVDSAGVLTTGTAVSRTCGFLVKAADNIATTSAQASGVWAATTSTTYQAVTYTFTAVTNVASLIETAATT